MKKTILLTGATDGIGLETAKILVVEGHTLLLHGRNPQKLDASIPQRRVKVTYKISLRQGEGAC